MPISKVKSGSITDSAVTSDKINNSAVTSAKIQDGSIVNADINACAAIASSKLTVDTTALETDINTNKFNISLLGFKMAVNEGLTVFNLVDGVVDEFNDESGTDEAEGSNDTYCTTNDYYSNQALVPTPISAGFSLTTITEPDTSTAGTNPDQGSGTPAQITLSSPASLTVTAWGAGGSGGFCSGGGFGHGGGGGFATGTYSFTGPDTLYIIAGEGGSFPQKNNNAFGGDHPFDSAEATGNRGGGGRGCHGAGGGLAFVGLNVVDQGMSVPDIVMIAGSGGGGGEGSNCGGAGGGLIAEDAGGGSAGEGGEQTAGGAAGSGGCQAGGFLYGGDAKSPQNGGGGGAGFYGGGGGGWVPCHGAGGGGSSYIGNPNLTCASTTVGVEGEGGGVTSPLYVAGTNEAGDAPGPAGGGGPTTIGEDGYVLITGSYCVVGCTTSTTIVSSGFTSSSVATNARIVVFEEDIETPTLNTDVVASISRDGGTTFTNATLSDSGYVTGSSGQRILTGQADISGQPSGQSMRWKLALANNAVKIHGVSLQWS